MWCAGMQPPVSYGGRHVFDEDMREQWGSGSVPICVHFNSICGLACWQQCLFSLHLESHTSFMSGVRQPQHWDQNRSFRKSYSIFPLIWWTRSFGPSLSLPCRNLKHPCVHFLFPVYGTMNHNQEEQDISNTNICIFLKIPQVLTFVTAIHDE